jgi:hypothetical protein
MYVSFLGIAGALHLNLFEQPVIKSFNKYCEEEPMNKSFLGGFAS